MKVAVVIMVFCETFCLSKNIRSMTSKVELSVTEYFYSCLHNYLAIKLLIKKNMIPSVMSLNNVNLNSKKTEIITSTTKRLSSISGFEHLFVLPGQTFRRLSPKLWYFVECIWSAFKKVDNPRLAPHGNNFFQGVKFSVHRFSPGNIPNWVLKIGE